MSLEGVLERLNAAVMLLDETGRVSFSNSACERTLGDSPTDFTSLFPGTDWADLLARLEKSRQILQLESLDALRYDVTLSLTEADPKRVLAELAPANQLSWPGEESLLRAQRRLEMAQESGGSAYFEFVPGWNRFVTSSVGARMIGVPGTSYTLAEIRKFLGEEDGRILEQHFESVLATGGTFDMEVPIVRPDTGEARWILVKGEMRDDAQESGPPSMLGTLQDITERKRTSIELSSSRALLAEAEWLLEGFSFQWDLETNRWSVSQNFYRLVGATDKPSRRLLESYICEADRQRVIDEIRLAIREDRDFRIEHRSPMANGDIRYFQLIGRALRNERGRVIRLVGAASNITELKDAQRGQRESEAKFRAFIEAFPGTVFIKNADYRYVFATASADYLQDSRLTPADVTGRTAEEVHGPEQARLDNADEDEVRRTGKPKKIIRQAANRDGETRYLVGALFPIELDNETFVGGYYIDDTARITADKQKERLMHAVEHSGEMIVITDTESTIVYVNPVFERIMGYSRDEVIGGHNKMWRSGLHDQSLYDNAWEQLKRGEVWQGTLINKRKDGSLIHEETTISQIRDPAGEVVGYVEVKRDVTRQRELEQQLAQSQKLESIGTLAGGVAHDYNNVLQTILGNTEILLDQFGDHDDMVELATEIKNAAEQSASLTAQLLAFARKQVIMPRAADLNVEFSSLRNMLQRLIGSNIRLVHETVDDLWTIRMDPSQIRQVMTNIVVNSRDAIDDVGEIHVRMSNVPSEQLLHLPTGERQTRDFVRIDIVDNGAGMTEEEKERAFEPFFTTKPMNEGTGLGLATVYGIMKQNDGYVFCESQPGVGTKMTLLLPRHHGVVHESLDDAGDQAVAVVRKRILVVEDDQAILKLMVRSLSTAGYDIESASSPGEAVRLAGEHRFDLVLTDIIMPEKNGLDLFAELKQEQPDLIAIFMSGYSADILDGVDEDCLFIQKPFRQKELLERVAGALSEVG